MSLSVMEGVGRRKKKLPVDFFRRLRHQKTRPRIARATMPMATPRMIPSFLSLERPLEELLLVVGEPVCSASTDVVVGEPVAPGWTLYVDEPTTTALGQVSVLIAVSDVEG